MEGPQKVFLSKVGPMGALGPKLLGTQSAQELHIECACMALECTISLSYLNGTMGTHR
jgi:hypothetical protein